MAILLGSLSSLPASASVTCAVRRNGAYVCTYFCQDGFVCDVANNRCNPGPALKKKASDAAEAARQSTLNYNRSQVAQQTQAYSDATGYGSGSVYYLWDGDPREIPTPRYRYGGGYSTGSSRPATSPSAPAHKYTVRPQQRDQLLALLAAARSFAPGSPNYDGAVKLLRRFVRDNKIPVDVDDLLDCGTPKPETTADKPKTFPLHWTERDIDDEIDKRGLCAKASTDDDRQACHSYQFGQVVMDVEPELKALCKMQENDFEEKDPEALGACAESKFRNALARDGQVPLPTTTSTSVADAKKCPDIGVAESLRDKLRKALAAANVGGDDGDDSSGDTPPPPAMPPAATPDAAPDAKADNADDDDPYCAFIARRAVRGELTTGGGDQIPDYCRKALDKAKSCAEQKCSMADIIDQQERQNAPGHVPWGVDDYQKIEQLQRQD
jgi:hypothetical protein